MALRTRGAAGFPLSPSLLAEQLYSDLPVLAPFSMTWIAAFRIAVRHEADRLCITRCFRIGSVSAGPEARERGQAPFTTGPTCPRRPRDL